MSEAGAAPPLRGRTPPTCHSGLRGGWTSAALALGLSFATSALAGSSSPQVTLLDLPFKIAAMRGPGSEVALAVATSGAVPRVRPKPASVDPSLKPAAQAEPADLVVVWGDSGGAALTLADGKVRVRPLETDAVEGFAAAETPRGAVSGSRRAAAGAVTAYLSGPVRSVSGARGQAAGLTIRERQPLAMSAEPQPVPIATVTVPPGADRVFAARHPRIVTIEGRPHILAILAIEGAGSTRPASALAAITKDASAKWAIVATSPPQGGDGPDGEPLALAAVADFTGSGGSQIAVLRAPDGTGTLQLWSIEGDALTLRQEAAGYAGARLPEDVVLAAPLPANESGPADLALPLADRMSLAVVSLKGGIRERARYALPSPAAHGVAVLGRGAEARILVGLADGRVAVVTPAGAGQ